MNFQTEKIVVDVVIVGGGGAGLRAAYEAALSGARTLLVSKGELGESGATAYGVASIAGFSVPDGRADPEDSPDALYADIMLAGAGCCDPALVRILVNEAISAAKDLECWGVEFIHDPNTGKPLVAMGDFASRPRNRKIYRHGKPITQVLKEKVKDVNVIIVDHAEVLDLLLGERGVNGVLAISDMGNLLEIRSGATVLATGGAGQLFNLSLMPTDITGDGYALAYRAGATLVNMEYMQAGFGTIQPVKNIVMAWFWALLPKFMDWDGRSVLEGLLPLDLTPEVVMKTKVRHYPFSTSDESKWLEIGAKKAIDEMRTTDLDGFQLDFREIDEGVLPRGSDLSVMWSISKEWLLRKGIDITKEPLTIGLFGHSINGGILITPKCESTVPGLLAVGEASGGPYGADRLGGTMLLNCQVFGKRAGRWAAEVGMSRNASAAAEPSRSNISYLFRNEGKLDYRKAISRIRTVMTKNVLVVRNERGLVKAAEELALIREEIVDGHFRASSIKEFIRLNETLNLVEVGSLISEAARLRRETRGSHYREDYPMNDPKMAKPIMIRCGTEGPEVFLGDFSPGTDFGIP